MLKYKITTDVTEEPVSLDEAKAHLRILDDAEDDYIPLLISSAREYAEGYHGCVYGVKTITAVADSLPDEIELPLGPATEISSIVWKDIDGAEHDVTGEYTLDEYTNTLIRIQDPETDVTDLAKVNPVVITYTAGQTPRARTRQAMLIMIGEWHENRENSVIGVGVYSLPLAAKQLLEMDRHPVL